MSLPYHDYEILTSCGHSYGGAELMVALGALEGVDLRALGNPAESVGALELMLAIQEGVQAQGFILDPAVLADSQALRSHIATAADGIARTLGLARPHAGARPVVGGTHSSHVIVIDADGEIVTGTHTIEALPWGAGLFAGGLPLAASAQNAARPSISAALPPGAWTLDPLVPVIVTKAGQPVVATGTYGTGMFPASFEVLTNLLDYGMSAEDAILVPRAGWVYFDAARGAMDWDTHMLDERFSPDVVRALHAAGYDVSQNEVPGDLPGYLDLGYPAVLAIAPEPGPRHLQAMTPDWIDNPARGY